MSTLLKNTVVVDLQSPYHGQTVDIRIQDDQIVEIGSDLEASKTEDVYDLGGASISPGWVEMHSDFADPGFEERESLVSGAMAALRGGFSTVCITPNTHPVIQSKSDIEYIYSKGASLPVNLFPIGALSKNLEGDEMTEMYDMFSSGAVAFSDGKKPVANPNLLKMALQYAIPHEMTVVNFPFEPRLAVGGQVNEGHVGTYLGMKGIPNLSEELMVARDIELLEYSGGKLHLSSISTRGSVERIRAAKAKGLNISCDVNVYNLVLIDEVVSEYDALFKVLPPIRSEDDRLALIEGVVDGTVDAVAVDHIPFDEEHKKCEFQNASFGMAYIEHAFGLYGAQLSNHISLERWVQCLTQGPREAYGLGTISILEGSPAELTVFSPDEEWSDNKMNVESAAWNQPFIGQVLKGRAKGVYNKGWYTTSSVEAAQN